MDQIHIPVLVHHRSGSIIYISVMEKIYIFDNIALGSVLKKPMASQ
jgi:hypothetical protein